MSREGWKKIKLREACTKIGSGATPRGGKESYLYNGPYALIRSQNVLDFHFSYKGLAYIDEAQARQLDNVTVEESDILLNITGDSVARVCQVPSELKKARVNQHVSIIRTDKASLNPQYLKYFLLNTKFKDFLLGLASVGGTRNALTKGMIEDFEIDAPKLSTQLGIATILSTLDEKIDLNRQTNATLEAIAQAIFKEWFVDFNFPGATGEMVESELGMIPRGWREGKLGEEGTFKNGINYSRDENGDTLFPIVNVRDVVESKFISKQNLDSVQINKQKAFPYLLNADDILLVRSASPGETAILLQPEQDIIYSGFTIRYRLIKKDYFLYLFFIFQNLKNALDHISNGTTLKNINQEMLKPYKVIIPNIETIIEFNNLIKPIFDSIQNTNQQSATVATLRDALLPKLMNGQIPVSADANAWVNNIGANNYSPLQTMEQTTTSKLAARRCPALPPKR